MYIFPENKPSFKNMPEESREALDSPKDMLIAKHSDDVLLHYQAPEFEIYKRNRRWYFYITLVFLAIIAYAIYTNSLVMAITFILIGAVGYIHIHKEPRILDFMIVEEGIMAGREIYSFENIESFWVFYGPEAKTVSLHLKSRLLPYISIPLGDQDPVKIREILLGYISEKKHKPSWTEIIGEILKI
jgi:hypothetical protein